MGAYVSVTCTTWWSGCRDLNPGPLRPERSALPSCATARSEFPRSPLILVVDRKSLQRLNRRRDLGLGRRMKLDDEFTYATLLQRLHTKGPVAECECRSRHGDLAGQVEDETGDGHVLALGNRES